MFSRLGQEQRYFCLKLHHDISISQAHGAPIMPLSPRCRLTLCQCRDLNHKKLTSDSEILRNDQTFIRLDRINENGKIITANQNCVCIFLYLLLQHDAAR
jgi:hypothetical protein